MSGMRDDTAANTSDHVKRRLLTILSALSLLSGIAMCLLSVRSHYRTDILIFKSTGGSLWFTQSNGGFIEVERVAEWPDEGVRWWLSFPLPPDEVGHSGYPGMTIIHYYTGTERTWSRLGISGTYGRTYLGKRYCSVWIPLSTAALFCSVLPMVSALRYGARGIVRRRRMRDNKCIVCGYLLCGNASDRCPECGTIPKNADAKV